METKRQIRRAALAARNQMPPERRIQLDKSICGHLKDRFLGRREELKRRGVYGYYPHGSEANLLALYGLLLSEGIPLAFPRTKGEAMEFYQVFSLDDFKPGAFGIFEPSATLCRAKLDKAVCLVPGSVFDRAGNRYGYGKGYYDRYFADHKMLLRVGIAYGTQVKETIPSEAYDIKMHMLATEDGIFALCENAG